MRVVDCLYIHTDGGSTGVEGMAWMAIVALMWSAIPLPASAIGIGLN